MRRRDLSDDERALWDSVAKQARPLRKKKRAAVIAPSPLVGEGRTKVGKSGMGEGACVVSPPYPSAARAPKPSPAKRESAGKKASPPTHPLDRRETSRLARGHRDIDARIDLHGMTQARAHRALLAFLIRAQADGCRYVLVITGKGKVSADGSERGVLRRIVPEWLALAEFRALVTGSQEASIGHGGAGALYVRVRRG